MWTGEGYLTGIWKHLEELGIQFYTINIYWAVESWWDGGDEKITRTYQTFSHSQEADFQPGMVVHACNLNTQEAEIGGLWIQGQLGLQNTILTSVTVQNVTIAIIRPPEEFEASDFIQS